MHVEDEINCVACLIKNTAEKFLPHFRSKHKKKHRFTDKILSYVLKARRLGMNGMKKADQHVDDYMRLKCSIYAEVRKQVNFCAVMEERKRVQRWEQFFNTNANHQFKLTQERKKTRSSRLKVKGTVVSEPAQLLEAWTTPFHKLAQTQGGCNPSLKDLHKHMTTLLSESFLKEDTFLDVHSTCSSQ